MRTIIGNSVAGARKIDGQFLPPTTVSEEHQQIQRSSPDRIVRPVTRINGDRITFEEMAKFAWPKKTEANIAFHLKVDERTARRWLADASGPPAEALGVILAEIMRRFNQRE